MNEIPRKDDYLRVSSTTSLTERNRMETEYIECVRSHLERCRELTPGVRANLRNTVDFSIIIDTD